MNLENNQNLKEKELEKIEKKIRVCLKELKDLDSIQEMQSIEYYENLLESKKRELAEYLKNVAKKQLGEKYREGIENNLMFDPEYYDFRIQEKLKSEIQKASMDRFLKKRYTEEKIKEERSKFNENLKELEKNREKLEIDLDIKKDKTKNDTNDEEIELFGEKEIVKHSNYIEESITEKEVNTKEPENVPVGTLTDEGKAEEKNTEPKILKVEEPENVHIETLSDEEKIEPKTVNIIEEPENKEKVEKIKITEEEKPIKENINKQEKIEQLKQDEEKLKQIISDLKLQTESLKILIKEAIEKKEKDSEEIKFPTDRLGKVEIPTKMTDILIKAVKREEKGTENYSDIKIKHLLSENLDFGLKHLTKEEKKEYEKIWDDYFDYKHK